MGGFELLSPSGLWALAGAAPLVALYVLKIRRERVRVPSTWLWTEARRDLLAKHPFKRLLPEVPLLLELLALGALALAIARPASRSGAIVGDHVAIVVDTSASMAAGAPSGGSGATTRIDEAKRAARDVARRLAPGTDAFVVASGRVARAVTPLERDPRTLEAAIDRLEAEEIEGDLAAGVALAAERLRALSGSRRIVVVTDGSLAHDDALPTGGIDVQVLLVGAPADNAAIVRVDARAGVDAATHRDEAQVFAMLESYGERPRDAYVTLSIEGAAEPIASRRVRLEPHARLPVVLTFEPRDEDVGKALAVTLSPRDALPADDVAYARVPDRRRFPVVLASAVKGSWLARALRTDADVDLRVIDPGELANVNVEPGALVVVEGGCPSSFPGGDVLVVSPPEGECLGLHVGAVVDAPRVTSWDTTDARLRFLTLDGVHVTHARALGPVGARAGLVRSEGGALIADASIPGRAATVVAFDVGDSDWPLQASFVLFVRDVVELARRHRDQGGAAPARTGEPLRVSVPSGVTDVVVERARVGEASAPDDAPRSVAAKDGFVVIPPLSHAAALRMTWREPHVGAVVVPVNLTSERESDLRVRPPALDAGSGAAVAEASRAPLSHHEWSAWLALLAAIALAGEAAWLSRRARALAPGGPRGRTFAVAIVATAIAPLVYEALVYAGALRESYVRFDAPLALVAMPLAGAVLAWRLARLPARLGPSRRRAFTALAAAATLAAALAASQPSLGRPLDALTVLVAVDRSRSIDRVPGADERIRRDLALAQKGMRDSDRLGTVVFGAEAATEDPPHPRSELPPPQRIEIPRDGTDVDLALRRALAEVPVDTAARVVLVTDGVETRGDALAAASVAAAAGVPVDAVVLEQKAENDVRVASLHAPTRADRDEPIDLRIVTSSTAPADVEVRVSRDGAPLRTARAHVAAGEDVLHLREKAGDAGLHRYDVAVTALDPSADTSPEDNQGTAFVRVRGAGTALVLEGDEGKGAPLASALRSTGFLVDERSTLGVPADVAGLAAFDLVVLSDVRASDLARTQVDALASYARDLGGGLLLMGGDRSMGPGGYARTAVEDVSPVAFDLKQQKRRASLAEVIAIDYSGSMGANVGGRTKLSLANEAAARSASLLGPGDRLGVEHVDTAVTWTVPVAPVTDGEAIGAQIRRTGVGGGGIYTDVALRAGYEALVHENVNLKHLLLFADGDDAEQIQGCRPLVKDAAARGVTTSVISLGRGHDSAELEVLSKLGGGRFYLIDDATKLPAVFTQETILATKSALHEDPFSVALGDPSPATRGVSYDAAPPLGGYVVTVPKPRATVALTGPEGDPLLATWSVGLGRAGAFTSDYKDRWGSPWLRWPGGAATLGQLGRALARTEDDPRVRLESDATGGELHVRADVVGDDGRAQTFRRLSAHVAGPDGFARDVPLEATGPGRYGADVPLSRPGAYLTSARDDASGELVGTTGAALSAGEEMRPTASDRALLTRVAAMTGGKVRDTLAGVFDDRGAPRFSYVPVATWLEWLAATAMLLGVAARRMGVPEVWATRRKGPSVPATAPQARTLATPSEERAPQLDAPAPPPPTPQSPVPTHDAAKEAEAPASTPPLTAAERLLAKRRQRR